MKDKSSILRKSIKMGSVEHETKVSNKEGEIMAIASKDVISIPPTKSIKDTAKVMMEHEFRRLPIADPGSVRFRYCCSNGYFGFLWWRKEI